jgi:tRNA threonylcarbamoyladenosine biosynthesis protein TsaE
VDLILADEASTTCAGAALARCLPDIRKERLLVAISGELGSGKTTLARGLLRALGVAGSVHSPTFTLVEPYETARGTVHHIDLYRIRPGARALDSLGIRDICGAPGLVLVEWPERADGALGTPDLAIRLEHREAGRGLSLLAQGESGREWLAASRASLEECCVSR